MGCGQYIINTQQKYPESSERMFLFVLGQKQVHICTSNLHLSTFQATCLGTVLFHLFSSSF